MNYSNFRQSQKKRLLLTKEGIDKLRKKVDEITSRRYAALKNLHSIDRNDDLHLLEELQQLEAMEREAATLDELLLHVEPVTKRAQPDAISTGCTVQLKFLGETALYTIVSPLELDIENNKISEDSIMGKAVLGKKVGDSFSVTTPKGNTISYEVISIS